MNQNLKDTVRFFYKLIASQKSRLEYGSHDRKRIRAQIDANQKPTGYRVDWILKSSNEIIILLGQLAKDFNNMYPEDKISSDDYSDVLSTAINKIKRFTKKTEEDDDE